MYKIVEIIFHVYSDDICDEAYDDSFHQKIELIPYNAIIAKTTAIDGIYENSCTQN